MNNSITATSISSSNISGSFAVSDVYNTGSSISLNELIDTVLQLQKVTGVFLRNVDLENSYKSLREIGEKYESLLNDDPRISEIQKIKKEYFAREEECKMLESIKNGRP